MGGTKKAAATLDLSDFNRYATPFAVAPARPDGDPCPVTGNWLPRPPVGRLQESALRTSHPGLPGICGYKWKGKGLPTTEQDFKSINGTPDHPLLTLTAPNTVTSLPPEVYQPLLRLFEKRAVAYSPSDAERARALEARVAAPSKAGAKSDASDAAALLPPVRVAVVDATPRKLGMKAPDRSGHGFAVSRVAGTLACPKPDDVECTDRVVVAHLALPIIDEMQGNLDEDWDHGGRTGTPLHLSDALEEAIEEWRPVRQRQHLIINLSVGWDPIKLDERDDAVRRIRTLLERASCLGALIVAAAGNFTGSSGPIYPAAFEAQPAPRGDRCHALLAPELGPKQTAIERARWEAKPRYAPLVHSVGAVDALDQRTLVNRRWGQPRLSALGATVTVPGPPGTPHTPVMDGTSMSAAIVSGIAAKVWAVRPDLDAAGVMQIVYESGMPLKVGNSVERPQTEYCLNQKYGPCSGWPVRRASLCRAMSRVTPSWRPVCDESPPTEREMAHWPKQAGSNPRPSEACRLTECGVPFGPVENQLPAGVGGHGLASCNGCTFHLDPVTQAIKLNGTPTSPLPANSMSVSATFNSDMNPPVLIFPQFGLPMNDLTVLGMNVSTTQGSITWTISVPTTGLTFSTTSPLAPN
jgi:hypothetical protein